MENLLAEAGATDEDDAEPTTWPVSVEADLLTRVRAQGFDLDELFDQHRAELDETECLCIATPAKLRDGEWFAIMTAVD